MHVLHTPLLLWYGVDGRALAMTSARRSFVKACEGQARSVGGILESMSFLPHAGLV